MEQADRLSIDWLHLLANLALAHEVLNVCGHIWPVEAGLKAMEGLPHSQVVANGGRVKLRKECGDQRVTWVDPDCVFVKEEVSRYVKVSPGRRFLAHKFGLSLECVTLL